MNQELIAHLKELLKRVEACPFDLEANHVDIDVHMYGTEDQSKAIAESLSDFATVEHRKHSSEELDWHKGRIGKLVEITTFVQRGVWSVPVAEPQVQEAVQ